MEDGADEDGADVQGSCMPEVPDHLSLVGLELETLALVNGFEEASEEPLESYGVEREELPCGDPALPAAVGVDGGVGQHHADCWEEVGEDEGEGEDVEIDFMDFDEVHEPGGGGGAGDGRGEGGDEEEGGNDGCEAEVLEEEADEADAEGISMVRGCLSRNWLGNILAGKTAFISLPKTLHDEQGPLNAELPNHPQPKQIGAVIISFVGENAEEGRKVGKVGIEGLDACEDTLEFSIGGGESVGLH